MTQRSLFVYGPAGCGKTRNAEALRDYLCLTTIIDGWNASDGVPPKFGALILTNVRPTAKEYAFWDKCSYDHVIKQLNRKQDK